MQLQLFILYLYQNIAFNVVFFQNTLKQPRTVRPRQTTGAACLIFVISHLLSLVKPWQLNFEARLSETLFIKYCNNNGLTHKKLLLQGRDTSAFPTTQHDTFHLIWNSAWVWSNHALPHPLASYQNWNPLLTSPYFLFHSYYPHLVLSLSFPYKILKAVPQHLDF